tara:strand:+ start:353 stop:739 length:387 start_codon:yes stop_codon:yes gene_type:complete
MSDFQKWFIDQFQFAGWLPPESSDLSRGSTLAWNHQQKRIDELELAYQQSELYTETIRKQLVDALNTNVELEAKVKELEADRTLTKPAKVGNGTFRECTKERLVIEAAQRAYEYRPRCGWREIWESKR